MRPRQFKLQLMRNREPEILESPHAWATLRRLGGRLPAAWLRRHHVQWQRNIVYRADPALSLDIFRPTQGAGPFPVVLYVHGGGFNILSKDSHVGMAFMFAQRGYLVVNIDYRLAPRHPFPAALEDTFAAYAWAVQNIARFGGNPTQIILAGESAGANLITALTLGLCYDRPEPYTRAARRLGVLPRAVLPACGLMQVSDPGRFKRRKPRFPIWIQARLNHIAKVYLASSAPQQELADPLRVLEEQRPPARPLPPFFIAVGTRDPLLDDSRRLKAALDGLHVAAEARYYVGGVHAFHAFMWRPLAREFWQDTLDFVQRHASPAQPGAARA